MKQNYIYLLYFCLFLFFSCSNSENTDDINPSIVILNVSDGDIIKNEVKITIDASDNPRIERVEFWINNNLLSTDNQPPYELTWNTTTVEDGLQTLKVMAFDEKGTVQEKSINVTVKNVLVNIMLNQYGKLSQNEMTFIVTDLEGKHLKTVPFSDIDILTITPKEIYEGEYINLFVVNKYNNITDVSGYYLLKRGSEFGFISNTAPAPNGTITCKVKIDQNTPPFEYLTITTDYNGRSFANWESNISDPISLGYTKDSKLIIKYEDNEKGFYTIKDILNDGQIFEIDLNDCKTPLELQEIEVPENNSGYFYVFGRVDGDKNIAYFLNQKRFYGPVLKYFYPDFQFQKHVFSISSSSDEGEYTANFFGDIPQTVTPHHVKTEIINSKASDFKASFIGEFDFYQSTFYNQSHDVRFIANAPSHLTEFKAPDISGEIGFSNFKPNELELEGLRINEIPEWEEDQPFFKYYQKFPHAPHPLSYSIYYNHEGL